MNKHKQKFGRWLISCILFSIMLSQNIMAFEMNDEDEMVAIEVKASYTGDNITLAQMNDSTALELQNGMGVYIKSNKPEDADMQAAITMVKKDSEAYSLLHRYVTGKENEYVMFVSFYRDGKPVVPSGSIELYYDMQVDVTDAECIFVDDNISTNSKLNYEAYGNRMKIRVSESGYIIIRLKEIPEEKDTEDNSEVISTEEVSTLKPESGEIAASKANAASTDESKETKKTESIKNIPVTGEETVYLLMLISVVSAFIVILNIYINRKKETR